MFEYIEEGINICMFNITKTPEIKQKLIANLTDEKFLIEYNNWWGISINFIIRNAPEELEIFTRV
jgi:hypothetical protein